MTISAVPRGLGVAVLNVLLASCSVTRHTTPTSTEELADSVLIISEQPDGQVTHSWQRAKEFDLSRYRRHSSNKMKLHHKEILVGSVVMIAGVVFVTVSAGAGLVVLAPIALVASPGIPSEPYIAGVSP